MSDAPPEPSPDPSVSGASESASAALEDDAPYQSLYRRYRPARFEEVRGQDHVVLALRNAVRDDRVAHAYLFSGPRGTGKTSTARILAKALNCTDLTDGEPCGVCPSCVEIAKGTSLDVHELDAASNNGVEAMRDLVSRAALGTPGRQKVYIVDEVHMLSTAASNALLKTLEEPPAHVVFVLATTDPQKVLPTIRSRTQHFEFRLLDADTLGDLLTQVRNDAHLDVTDEGLDVAIRRGKGSARDALSVLDQVAASDSMDDALPELSEIAEALAERDTSRALVAVAHLASAGWSPQQLAGDLVEHLRQAFLTMVAPELVSVGETERDEITALGERLGLAAVVRGMEVLGLAQVAMREAPDPRVNLEVALVRLAHPDVDVSPEALVTRIERLERAASAPLPSAGDAVTAAPVAPAVPAASAAPVVPAAPSASAVPAAPADPAASGAPAGGRKTLGAIRRQAEGSASPGPGAGPQETSAAPGPAASVPPVAASGPSAASGPRGREQGAPASGDPASSEGTRPAGSPGTSAPMPTRDELVEAWGDHVLGRLRPKAKALFQAGRFVGVEGDQAMFGLPNETHRMRCEEVRADVEAALSEHFGRRVPLVLVVDDSAGGAAAPAGRSSAGGTDSNMASSGSSGPSPSESPAPSSGSSFPSGGSASPSGGSPSPSGGASPSVGATGSAGPVGSAPSVGATPPGPRGAASGSRSSSAPSDRSAPVEDDDDQDFSVFDESELGDVADVDNSPAARVLQAFPGAEEVD